MIKNWKYNSVKIVKSAQSQQSIPQTIHWNKLAKELLLISIYYSHIAKGYSSLKPFYEPDNRKVIFLLSRPLTKIESTNSMIAAAATKKIIVSEDQEETKSQAELQSSATTTKKPFYRPVMEKEFFSITNPLFFIKLYLFWVQKTYDLYHKWL